MVLPLLRTSTSVVCIQSIFVIYDVSATRLQDIGAHRVTAGGSARSSAKKSKKPVQSHSDSSAADNLSLRFVCCCIILRFISYLLLLFFVDVCLHRVG
jgi:hypothetical protein